MNNSDEKPWLLLSVDSSRGSAVFRALSETPEDVEPARFSNAIEISWAYDSKEGYPVGETQKAMESFEEAIDPLCYDGNVSRLALVTTGMGVKEWLLYTTDKDSFFAEFNHCLSTLPHLPLTIRHRNDPTWERWREIVVKARLKANSNKS